MNRLILTTISASPSDEEAMKAIFKMWQRNALILCREAQENKAQDNLAYLYSFAKALGIDFICNENDINSMSPTERACFFTVSKEAIANSVKHARASYIKIEISENEQGTVIKYINDGQMPTHKVEFQGGLLNLQRVLVEYNAEILANVKEVFELEVLIKK